MTPGSDRSEPEMADLNLFKARFDHLRNPRNGKDIRIVTLTGNDSVTVMAVTPAGNVVMADNFRFGIMAYSLETAGGMVDPGEDHQAAAKETGVARKKLATPPPNGITSAAWPPTLFLWTATCNTTLLWSR